MNDLIVMNDFYDLEQRNTEKVLIRFDLVRYSKKILEFESRISN